MRRRLEAYPIPSVDLEKFSNLLGSGRKADLETLAKRLSARREGRATVMGTKVRRN
jgi:hypothetical protein